MPHNQRKVTIVDYGMGNIRSLSGAISHLGWAATVSGNATEIANASAIILPGVGSFPAAMDAIRKKNIDAALHEALQRGKSRILGICLGMQLLMTSSAEDGGAHGIGLVEGAVARFSPDLGVPIPHVGFNGVLAPEDTRLFSGLPDETDFYFVHSYRAAAAAPGGRVATTVYGEHFVSAFEEDNTYGTQFHPEKSRSNGLVLLSNFLAAELV